MSEIDPEDVPLSPVGLRMHSEDWEFPFDSDAFLRAHTAIARREERERIAKGLRVVKAVQKLGLPVKGATVEGVELQFGEPDAVEKATLTPLEAWKAKHARSA